MKDLKQSDYLALVRKGYAQEADNNFTHLVNTLSKYDPALLPVFQTYYKVAYQEAVSVKALDSALEIITSRLRREQQELGKPSLNLTTTEMIEVSKTRADKVIALDAAISGLHFDPDLLRALPKSHQPLVGQSIIRWLDQLAGREHK